ncbi:MAG: NIPSNAP family protein [Myxococcota bacterium]
MPIMVEIRHRLSPATPKRYEDFVVRYGDTVIPLMEECGWDVLGGWMWATGSLFSDLVLAQFESMAAYEEAATRLASHAGPGGLDRLTDLDTQIQQQVDLATTSPFATSERLEAAFDRSAGASRTFTYARLKTTPENVDRVTRLVEQTLTHVPPTTQLITSYASLTGSRGEIVDLWARDEGVPNFGFQTGSPPDSIYEELYSLVEEETIHYMNALPYSRLR